MPDPGLDKVFDEALVVLKSLAGESVDRFGGDIAVETARLEYNRVRALV